MKTANESEPLKKERRLTDESLTVERGETDESFINHSQQAESETDTAVKKDRSRADQARLQMRSEVDLKIDITKVDLKSSAIDPGQLNEERLLSERLLEDKAIENRRSNVDAAMEREREVKQIQIQVLLSQRQNTDKNLMSERVKTDDQADQAASLLQVEKAAHIGTKTELTSRDEFLAIVSHDLRNPVGAISSCAEMLLADAELVGIGEKALPMIELIKRNADLSLRLISDILDLERIAQGKLELQLQPGNIAEIINEAVSNLSYIAKTKKISLAALHSHTSTKIVCDRDRVSQILSNLIGNSLKFTPAGGSITVKTEETKNEITVST